MLNQICLITAITFAVTYPLCFWINVKEPLKQNFHRFHIGLPCFIAGIIAVCIFVSPQASNEMKSMFTSWAIILLVITYLSWNKETPNPVLVTIPCVWGVVAFTSAYEEILRVDIGPWEVSTALLSGLILSSALYAMNLGHWYLNVHGLPIKHLRRAVNVFAFLLITRAILNKIAFFAFKTNYDGELIPLWKFSFTVDGFLVWLAIFFGILFPLGSLFFVHGVLKVRNTQSATGILYVILSGILIGDLTYKYYLLKFGVAL